MRKTVRKLFWLWQFEKEERWLAQMSARGLALAAVGWCRYDFDECEPGEYSIRLELLDHRPSHPESQQYIRFVEETGAQYLGSVNSWAYFRRRSELGPFDLFSDLDSRIRHLGRMLALILPLLAANLGAGGYNLAAYMAWRMPVSLCCALLSAAVTVLLVYGYWRIWKHRRRLQQERLLRE